MYLHRVKSSVIKLTENNIVYRLKYKDTKSYSSTNHSNYVVCMFNVSKTINGDLNIDYRAKPLTRTFNMMALVYREILL